jgi:hypothetical protein
MVERTPVQRALKVDGSKASIAALDDFLARGWMVAATVRLDDGALIILQKALTNAEWDELKRGAEAAVRAAAGAGT